MRLITDRVGATKDKVHTRARVTTLSPVFATQCLGSTLCGTSCSVGLRTWHRSQLV